jgi:RNA polymerase sigma factor (sigma-70 family)
VNRLRQLVLDAQGGDLGAYGQLVDATQAMAYGVAVGTLRDPALAQDATQEAYLRGFRRLAELQDPATFSGWLRRIVVTVSIDVRRTRRGTLLQLDDLDTVPVLDEAETRWSDAMRHRLAAALLALSAEERRMCDRRYHGRWSIDRLARTASVDQAVMRKRLQRMRDKLRREIEMAEQRGIDRDHLRPELPRKIVELLARPRLTDLPENPVGRTLRDMRTQFAEFDETELPEVVNLTQANETIGEVALYVDAAELHHLDAHRILRYDLTLPLMLTVRHTGQPLRIWAAGKAYRSAKPDAMHLEAFHQAEMLWVDEKPRLDPWEVTTRVLRAVDRLLPGSTVKIVPTAYPMCTQSWELEVERDGGWTEVLAWGVFTDRIVAHLGADPSRHVAVGVGCGLERLAMLRYDIDDIRKVDVASVA